MRGEFAQMGVQGATSLPVSKGGAFAQSPDALRQVVLGYNLPHFNNCYADSSDFGGSFFAKNAKTPCPRIMRNH